MKLSIVIPVLESHEIVRRQLLHIEKFLPNDVELIIVDDGSEKPLENTSNHPNIKFMYTHDKREWTWALALNWGIRESLGEYFMILGVDHFITEENLLMARDFVGERLGFKRRLGIIDEEGKFDDSRETLMKWGISEERLNTKGRKLGSHNGIFVMRKDVWNKLGGYDETLFTRPYPQGEERRFKKVWCNYTRDKILPEYDRPTVYMFPNGKFCGDVDYNPFGLFHNLSRKTKQNSFFHEEEQNKPTEVMI